MQLTFRGITLAVAAVAALCYFGRPILVPMVCALLLGFLLDPLVRGLERIRLPRALAAFIVMLALSAAVWGVTYFSYVRVAAFVKDLPKYSEKIKESIGKVREQSQKLEKAKPTDADINAAITNICRCGTFHEVRAAIHAAASA